jgi:hypothetical protein
VDAITHFALDQQHFFRGPFMDNLEAVERTAIVADGEMRVEARLAIQGMHAALGKAD